MPEALNWNDEEARNSVEKEPVEKPAKYLRRANHKDIVELALVDKFSASFACKRE